MSLNPPAEKLAAISGTLAVPPTVVTLRACAINYEYMTVTTKEQRSGTIDLLWTTRRENRHEPGLVLAVVRDARLRRRVGEPSNTPVSRTEQYRSSAGTY
jgi:hypothetical protein